MTLRADDDVVLARHRARELAAEAGMRLVDQTKLVTAVSELARNTVVHGGGGVVHLEVVREGSRSGVGATFVDEGDGIPDVEQALHAGFSTGAGLGLGLGGAQRLVHEFDVSSARGDGTTVHIVRWA